MRWSVVVECRHFFSSRFFPCFRPRALVLSAQNRTRSKRRTSPSPPHLDPRRRGVGPTLLQPGGEEHRRRTAFDDDDGAKSADAVDVVAAPHRRPGRRGEATEQRYRCAAGRHVQSFLCICKNKGEREKTEQKYKVDKCCCCC